MNRMVRKGAAAFLIMLSLCLAGCGGKEKESKESAADEKKNLAISTKEEGVDEEAEQDEQVAAVSIQPDVEELSQALSGGGKWAVYVCGLESARTASVNNKSMQSASLIKLFIAGTVYERKAEVESQDANVGETEKLLEAMITVSDNSAANTLIKRLGNGDAAAGMQAVNEFAESGGYVDTHLGRLMLDFDAADDNYTSVSDCGKFLQEVYSQSLAGSAELLDLMKRQERTGKLPAGVPEGTITANKTGELDTVENDAAIIWGEKEPYVICVMSEELLDAAMARESMKTFSKNVYGLMNE